MKKIFSSLPKLIVAAALSFAVGCNSGSSTEDTSTAESVGNSPGASTSGDIGGDSAGIANTTPTNDANAVMTDTGLISKDIVDNMTEIQLSKLGKEKGTNAQVKKIATQMFSDHTQMLSDMKTLAGKKNIQVPTGSIGETSMLASLRSAAGKDFDNSWSAYMLTMHEAKIRELENALSQTQDADLKTSINKALPKIKAHRDVLTKLSTGAQNPQ